MVEPDLRLSKGSEFLSDKAIVETSFQLRRKNFLIKYDEKTTGNLLNSSFNLLSSMNLIVRVMFTKKEQAIILDFSSR